MAVMKISVLSMYWNEPQGGGINAYVTGLVTMLRNRHPENPVDVLYVQGDGDPAGRVRPGALGEMVWTGLRIHRLSPEVNHVNDQSGFPRCRS